MQPALRLDGSKGEGGGQILRTAATLSTLLGRPFTMDHIRAARPKPGLRAQHAGVLRFLAEATGGEVDGAEVGAEEVTFRPGTPVAGTFAHDIGTAGSITLFLQAVLPVFLLTRGTTELRIQGGTDVPFSPPLDWYTRVYFPYLAPLVHSLELEVVRRGFYPVGGGEVVVRVENPGAPEAPHDVAALRRHVTDRLGDPRIKPGFWGRCDVRSMAVQGLRSEEVAERQSSAAAYQVRRRLRFVPTEEIDYVGAHSSGSAVVVRLADESGNIIAGDALGEADEEPETVGRRAAGDALNDVVTGATVDRHLADQVVPWIALGAGAVRVPRTTGHLVTNVDTCRAFLGEDAVRLDGLVLRGA